MAIIRPCPNHASCQPINGFQFTNDPDSPVANLSSEAPDPVDFAWTKFLYNDPPINSPNNFWNNPYGTGTGTITCPPGTLQTSQGCQGYCELNPWSSGCAPVTREAVTGSNPGRTLFSNSEQVCVDFCDDGSQFVHSVEAGRVIAVTQGQADAIALAQCQLEVEQQKICFGTNSLPGACVDNIPYAEQIQASGGVPLSTGNAYSWEISMGSLPPGLSLNPTNGKIGGFPTTGGSYTFTIKITDGLNNSSSREFTITIIEITTATALLSGAAGYAYTGATLVANPTGGIWSISGGALPTGLSLNSTTGAISGTPDNSITTQVFSFTAQVIVGSTTCTKNFTLKIWTHDSTNTSFQGGPQPGPFANIPVSVALGGGANYGPGLFRVTWNTGNSVWFVSSGAGNVASSGGTHGLCAVTMATLDPIGPLDGCSASGGTPQATAQGCLVGLGTILEFELSSPTPLTYNWAAWNNMSVCGTSPTGLFGGTGSWTLTQIGKP